ncbi:hypothetical protein OG234_13545 [Streptomyces sp. NBC_01420]|uniref:hypothetical protein n=1 Tax=Streptomyces sp. NBC_01420 TaxID=2903858 RepID=UPI003245FD9A
MPKPAHCTSCGAPIWWTITDAGRRLAVDAAPDPEKGNTAVMRDGRGTYVSRRPTDELPLMAWEKLHVPHVATCETRRPVQEELPVTQCLGVIRLDDHRKGGRRP